ncbi:MAG: L-threonylcarbamoyladenylate synthase [Dehalococcoidia bacterium]
MPIVQPADMESLVAAINRGEVVAIPTDTVYGLAARADDAAAVARIAEAKGRSAEQPTQLLVSSIEAIAPYLEDPAALDRVRPFWPGAVTAIVRVRPGFADAVVTRAGTVGVRVPDDALAIAVIEACGGALAASSANRHGEAPALTAEEVAAAFGEALLILDGGPRLGGMASTVVDLASGPPRLLRAGPVSARDLGIPEPGTADGPS